MFFFFSFALYLTINALFFTDKLMHKIYIDEGKYVFIYQIPKIIYSNIISTIINFIMVKLAISENNILDAKKKKKDKKDN